MKHTIQKGAITTLAIIVTVVITSITLDTFAELKHQLPQDQKDPRKISIQDSQNVVTGSINAKGDVIIGGSKVTNIYGFVDYQKLVEQIKELEQDLKDIPTDKVLSRLNKGDKLEKLRKQEQDFKQQVIRLAETFNKIEINTERLKQAQQYFAQGKFREADAVLKAEELSLDQKQLLDAKVRKTRELEELNKQLISNSSEFLIKAQITATNLSNPNRFQDACSFYEKSIQSYPTFENLFQYAYFLHEHNQHNDAGRYYQEVMNKFGREMDTTTRAMTLNNLGALQAAKNEFEDALKSYREALEIYRKLAQANPQSYLPDVAMTLNNLSIFYQASQPDKETSIKYAMEALEILAPFLEKAPYTQRYAQSARQVLQGWGVDIEKMLAEDSSLAK
ncbi:MAG: tetratricopeptide repeat protein [Candidatus Brocadia sp.]|nr:tetratricopeptide repeat protein [Candidatus Brocadia sp.]MDG6027649.1 tetratricopeptide repeat protein [Candidatus Brocadia sp.]